MHGYALAQHIKGVSAELLQIEEGSLCPALQRMLKVGWLEGEMGISARNRPVRIFKLTKAGAKHPVATKKGVAAKKPIAQKKKQPA